MWGVQNYKDSEELIKSIRKKENLTQEQFAIKLNVSRQAVSNWENNKNMLRYCEKVKSFFFRYSVGVN